MKPCFGHVPVSHHGIGGDIQDLGDLVVAEAAKNVQFHDLCFSRIVAYRMRVQTEKLRPIQITNE